MARLIICEKPSVATDVAKALADGRRFEKDDWGYRSPDLLVAAAAGHLVAELPPEEYDDKWKEWRYDLLPIIPPHFKYKPRDQRAATRLRQLAALINDPDTTEIINACDAGREGELIFKLIVQYARNTKPVRRAWFSSMTAQAIQDAFANLRDDTTMAGLEAAARCRAEADWLVGMNATRATSCTLGGGRLLSLGRVQTPTLALIVNRDVEIASFTPETFYTITATFAVDEVIYQGRWFDSMEQGANSRLFDLEAANEVVTRVKASDDITVASLDTAEEVARAPKLFDLTDLQREANKRFGFTASRTLAAAQSCYETHKVLSYPRTDSRYLPSDMATQALDIAAKTLDTLPELGQAFAATGYQLDVTPTIDDTKISDHHALIPTDSRHNLSALSDDERKIFELVAIRFIAALMPPKLSLKTTVWTVAKSSPTSDFFKTSHSRVTQPGWSSVYVTHTDDEDDSQTEAHNLHLLEADSHPTLNNVELKEGETKAPAPYNEATLLGAMASAGKLVADEEAAEAMKERGLGTPATRASIIERLVAMEYIERQGRKLQATDKGRGLVLALGDHPLTSPQLTGEWEQRLRVLERSTPQSARSLASQFSADIREFATQVVGTVRELTPEQLRAHRRTLATCPMPQCDGRIVDGKKGWGCSSYRSKEEQGCGFVLWKESSGKRLTEKQAVAKIEAMAQGREPLPLRPGERIEIGPCPKEGCEGTVVERQRSWGCDSWKSPEQPGCGYVIWKTGKDGALVTVEQARDMVQTGSSNASPPARTVGPCPRCDGAIVDRGKFLGCNSWKSPRKKGCGAMAWKTQGGTELSDDQLMDQIRENKDVPVASKRSGANSKRTKRS